MIVDGIKDEEYYALERISQSGIKELKKSPAHYRVYKDTPQEDTTERDFFKAVHLAVLEPHKFDDSIAIIDGHGASNSVKQAKAAAKATGKLVIKPDRYKDIVGIVESFARNSMAMEIMKGAKREINILWEHNKTPCKSRIDILSPMGIYDLKGFDGLFDDYALGRQIHRMGYHRQLAFYRRACFSVGLGDLPTGLIFYEPSPPYSIRVTEPFNYAVIEKADEEIAPLIDLYGKCLRDNEWPGPLEVAPIEFPSYGF